MGIDGKPCNCVVTGISKYLEDHISINYVQRCGEVFRGAEIPADMFIPDDGIQEVAG